MHEDIILSLDVSLQNLSLHTAFKKNSMNCFAWLLVFCSLEAIGTTYAAHSQGKTSVVRRTLCGTVQGFSREIHRGSVVESFLGIPYAKPPVGELRFEKPKLPDCWPHKIRDATQLPPACLQTAESLRYIERHRPGFRLCREDCLYLNVNVPMDIGDKLAVMVYVHGGSNAAGMGAYFDGDTFTAFGGVILVTINYRISTLGFLGTGGTEFPGNYALHDHVMAFRWVKDNIAFFKGDPNKVTIVGHSSGAFNVGLHMLSPLSKGLFRSAVCMSGSVMTPVSVRAVMKGAKLTLDRLARKLNCHNESIAVMKQCLKGIDGLLLVVTNYGREDIFDRYPFPALVDGTFLPDYPENLIKSGKINVVNMLSGITKDEGHNFINRYDTMKYIQEFLEDYQIIRKNDHTELELIRHEYTNWDAEGELLTYRKTIGDGLFNAPLIRTFDLLQEHHDVKLYMYRFEYVTSRKHHRAASHGSDLFYLFGAPFTQTDSDFQSWLTYSAFNYTDADRNMSRMYIDLFASFIRDGIPQLTEDTSSVNQSTAEVNTTRSLNVSTSSFPQYTSKLRPFVVLKLGVSGVPRVNVEYNFKPREISFWNNLIPNIRKQLSHKMTHDTSCSPRVVFSNLPKDGNGRDTPLYLVLFGVFLALSVILIVSFVVSIVCRQRQTIVVTM